jgi:uncharacterized SAM-binding protein YcdF (DUF218 family)
MTYYLSKVFWRLAAPTSFLVLISASAALWAVLGTSNYAAWLAAAAACGLVIGAFTRIGLTLALPLERRFPFFRPDPQIPLDGIIVLPGGAVDGFHAVSKLIQDYPKTRLAFCGFGVADKNLDKRLANLGVERARIIIEPQPRTTSEDALYSAALLKPKPSERWLLVTTAIHVPRAVGCFRAAGFQVKPYPVEFTAGGRWRLFTGFGTGSSALIQLDRAAKEWVGLVAYRLMGKTDALFPGP